MEYQGMDDVKQEQAMSADTGGAPEPYQHDQSATGAVKREGPFASAPAAPAGAAPVKAETDSGMDVDDDGAPTQVQSGGAGSGARGPSPDVADGSRSSSASEEILPDRRAAPALPLEKVDVAGLSLHHHTDSASEPASAADPDPLELDEAEAKVVEERAERKERAERAPRQRRTATRQPAQGAHAHSEDSEEDYSSSEEEEMRKTIMIGSAYQAVVPEGFTKYADKPYKHNDKLLWEPRGGLASDLIDQYLQTTQAMADAGADGLGLDLMPMGAHVRDDEQALFQLMQCNHNVEEALRKRHAAASPGPPNPSTPWTDEECRNFENGILTFGKDFHAIQAQRVRTRTVSEVVQFYYLWKKTERHDIFANKMRPEKKKYMLHPGVTLVVYELLDKENQKDAASRDPVTV